MKRVEFLETVKHEGQEFLKGDILTHKDGEYFQKLGWAKCAETGDTGKRIEGPSKIKPDNVVQVNS